MLVAALGVLLVCRAPRRTRAGDAALSRLATEYHSLSPSMRPDWAHYGPAGAALAVGVFGVGALWTADPAFATELAAQRASGSFGSTSSGDSSGGSELGQQLRWWWRRLRRWRWLRWLTPTNARRAAPETGGRRAAGSTEGPLHGGGMGIGWRPAIAGTVADLPGLRFCEVIAESLGVGAALP